jgi:glycosyltransferase involved in cell wall biosynthesis
MIALTLKRIFGPAVKVIYDYRGVFIEEQIYLGRWKAKSVKVRFAHHIESSNLAKADSIVVVSNALKSYLIALYGSRMQNLEKKISVIPNKTRILPKRVGKGRGVFGKRRITGVYSGSAAAWQCLPEMAEFCRAAVENFQRFSFTILTYEDKTPFLKYFGKEKSLMKRIQIICLRSGEVAPELAGADFGILLREEHLVNRVASPLKFAEYLASGIPVVASAGIGDTEEIIKKYDVGVVVRNRDYHAALMELSLLLKNKSLRNRCYEAARKEFNIEDAMDAYYSIYSHLLEKS